MCAVYEDTALFVCDILSYICHGIILSVYLFSPPFPQDAAIEMDLNQFRRHLMVFPCVVDRNIRDRRKGIAQESLNILGACLQCAKKYAVVILSYGLFSSHCVIGIEL